ncbi:hypothetical protein LTR35_013998 [Friedmanniomyces endolithicus]|nr:hypothetical protein LTR35_013998 [Friedmanniomyces endolithicus]KAK0281083.1 hypothetical protein LTS00_012724 [Friedmanniomyces endolithicus]KAK0987226.1 hypothetical protein LTR54_013179 [Friedmanniomyces endolithicus]
MKVVDHVTDDLRTDVTWNRVGTITARGARALPLGTKHYLLDKVPIVGWLPKYNFRWIVNDVIAGLTLGLLLIPQSLSYAKIATIPVEYGLQSSWLPATLYTFMGSTKDLSTGPTSLIGLMTSNVVSSLKPQGYSPQAVASAVAMCMGIMGMAIGFLNLGFLLEFISEPILAGFITAVALTIGLGQVSALLGEENVTASHAAGQIRQILRQLPQANGYACAVGFAGLLFLVLLEQSGKRWANQKTMLSRTIWFFSITRAFMCLLLFTGVSYAVNKHRGKHTLFDIVQLKYSGISAPEVPSATLIGKAFPGAIPAFIGGILEHVAIARAFGVKNNYVSDQTQEVTYFGVINFVNSFFHSMGVGGAMSRTSVNSMCKVKSPLSGLVTTAVILVCIFKLSGALYWIPKATLSAIIITVSSVIDYRLASARDRSVEFVETRGFRPSEHAMAETSADLRDYHRQSLRSSGLPGSSTGSGRHRSRTSCKPLRPNLQRLAANTVDLISSAMLAFWVCFFTTTYEGLAAAVGFNIIYVLLRQVFKPITQVGSTDQQKLSELQQSTLSASGLPNTLPDDVRIFRFHESFFFPNAYRLKTAILETIQTHHAPAYSTLHGAEAERNWSVHGERRVARLRKKAGIVDPSTLPPISIVVLDFTKVNHMDATAISHLRSLLKELRLYAGADVEVRFVGVSKTIRERFERARFTLHDDPWLATDRDDTWTENVPRAYRNLSVAVQAPRRRSSAVLVEKNEKMEHIEEV